MSKLSSYVVKVLDSTCDITLALSRTFIEQQKIILNRTLSVDSPSQTLALGLLSNF